MKASISETYLLSADS